MRRTPSGLLVPEDSGLTRHYNMASVVRRRGSRGSGGGGGGGGGGSGPGGADFYSDWPVRTGTVDSTEANLLDSTQVVPWDDDYSDDDVPRVLALISAAGRGFPSGMANILRCQASTANEFLKIAAIHWPTPGVGDEMFYRMYYRCEFADAAGIQSGGNHHPVQADDVGTWNWHMGNNTDGTFPIYIHWDSVLEDFYPDIFHGTLQKNRTYRLEWKVKHETSTTNSMAVRIYDADDTTLLFPNLGNTKMVKGDGQNLEQFAAGFNNGSGGIASLRMMELGCNGGPALLNQPQYQYYGGVMIRRDHWCGPY